MGRLDAYTIWAEFTVCVYFAQFLYFLCFAMDSIYEQYFHKLFCDYFGLATTYLGRAEKVFV